MQPHKVRRPSPRIWWFLRGLGLNGEHYLDLCQRCARRGAAHTDLKSVLRCWRFKALRLTAKEVRRIGALNESPPKPTDNLIAAWRRHR